MKQFVLIITFIVSLFLHSNAQSWFVIRDNPYGNVYGHQNSYVNPPGAVCYTYANPPAINFEYDAAGNRILRYVVPPIPFKVKKDGIKDLDIGETVKKFSTEESLDATTVRIFPNPTTSFITVEQQKAVKNGVLELYDSKGMLLIKQSADNNTTLETSSLPSGFYLLILRAGKTTAQWKITKL
jgi:hypothetical protein